jgi:peptide deformylase
MQKPMPPEIVTVAERKDEKFLRKKTVPFDFAKVTKKDVNELVERMRRLMHEANGIGLSANQIGLNFAVFVAETPDAQGGTKFYAVFNPKIEKVSKETATFEEGCLSVPGKWGDVTRAAEIVVSGQNKTGKPVKVKAWGLLARIFQHEIDHLNGKLFIDRAKKLYESEQTEG